MASIGSLSSSLNKKDLKEQGLTTGERTRSHKAKFHNLDIYTVDLIIHCVFWAL